MSFFTANYPQYQPGEISLLPTPTRVGALPEYTGKGVVIAFIDAGFYPHPDLEGRILLHVDATDLTIKASTNKIVVSDFSWHGQMTSVIACGDGSTSKGRYAGIASGAQVVLIKVSNAKRQIKEADILRGFRWIAQNHQRYGIKIVNVSVGGDYVSADPHHPLHEVVKQLTHQGVTVVIAAGNSPAHAPVPPASAPEAITVGGVDDQNSQDRTRWKLYHHSLGTAYNGMHKPEIIAPAAWIASPLLPKTSIAEEARFLAELLHIWDATNLRRYLLRSWDKIGITRTQARRPDSHLYTKLQDKIHSHKLIDANHQHVDGTSVSTPIVSAIIAQMLEANPRLTPAQIRTILTTTAEPLPNVPAQRQGAGVVNAAAAVQAALQLSE